MLLVGVLGRRQDQLVRGGMARGREHRRVSAVWLQDCECPLTRVARGLLPDGDPRMVVDRERLLRHAVGDGNTKKLGWMLEISDLLESEIAVPQRLVVARHRWVAGGVARDRAVCPVRALDHVVDPIEGVGEANLLCP